MANQADIKAVITAEDRASAALKGFGDNVSGLGHKIAGVAKAAGVALVAAGAAATAFGVASVKAYQESENVQAQLNAVLKSTHRAAGLYLQDLNDQSAALQKVTRFSDEQIGSAQAMLLTFSEIHGAVFQQAVPAILDLAQAMHEDLQSASIQVGKALNDPVTGITALHRIGVTFNQTQKDQIQHFVDTNQLAKAQGVILKELNAEFGGSAQAAGKTFGGQLIILKNRLSDIQETIGHLIVRAITPLVVKVADFVAKVDWNKVINKSVAVLRTLSNTIGLVVRSTVNFVRNVVEYVTPGVERFISILKQLAVVFMKWIWPSVESLGSALRDRLLPQIMAIWKTIEPGFTMALKVIGVVLGVTIVAAIKVFVIALTAAISVLGMVIRIVRDVIGWFGNLGGIIINVFRGIPNAIGKAWNGLVGILIWPFKTAFNAIADLWNGTVGKLHWTVPKWIPKLGGHTLGVPQIPKLAEGGIVTRPTIALIGEQGAEAVVPLNKGKGLGGNVNITIQAGAFVGTQMDARKHAMIIYKALQDIARSRNTTVASMIGAK